jgi:hypothetical protein
MCNTNPTHFNQVKAIVDPSESHLRQTHGGFYVAKRGEICYTINSEVKQPKGKWPGRWLDKSHFI